MAEGLLRSLAGNRFQVEERIIGVREITALDQKVRRLLLSGGEERSKARLPDEKPYSLSGLSKRIIVAA